MLRRCFLKRCSSLALSASWSRGIHAGTADGSCDSIPDSSLIEHLSSYMSLARAQALPFEVVESAKEHVLDTVAAMISGSTLSPGRIALRYARECGSGKCTIVASRHRGDPVGAAFVNGMLAHSDETDDSHSPSHSHPGCGVVPAAIAAGQRFGITGEQFLRAVVLGYDVGTRITMALGGLSYQTDTHRSTHSIANTFGASAAAGSCAGLGSAGMRWLLSYAAQQASGLTSWQRDHEHIEKSLVFAGLPARNGVQAALLIHLGANGVDDVFSGQDNFWQGLGKNAAPGKLIEELGYRFEVTQTNLKKWTVGSPIQAPLDALQQIRNEHPFETHQVDTVKVRLAPSEARTVNEREMQDISLQQMLAVMLVDGTVSFAASHDRSRLEEPAVIQQRAKIVVIPDEELEPLYPKLVAIVDVRLNDGRRYQQRINAVRGTVANPMSREEIITKSRGLMDSVVGTQRSIRIVDEILLLERSRTLENLESLLQV